MRSRRRVKTAREPLVWTRNSFSLNVSVAAGVADTLDTSPVSTADQLATPPLFSTAIDQRWTLRRMVWPLAVSCFSAANAGARIVPWCILAKASANDANRIVAQPSTFDDILRGGTVPLTAMDILDVKLWSFVLAGGTSPGFITGDTVREPILAYNSKVARKLEADEAIWAFWGIERTDALNVSGAQFHFSIAVSCLWQRTMRK